MWYEQKVRVRKPWCLAGLYLSGCTCWSILQIPEAGAKLQPAPALPEHWSSVWLPQLSGPSTPNTRSAPAICCWWGPRAAMSLLAWHWKVKVEHCANVSRSSPCPGYLGLICFVFEFHYDCCSLGAVLEGWLSALVRIGIPCAWPCTSSRVNSPSAHHVPAHAGSLLLH